MRFGAFRLSHIFVMYERVRCEAHPLSAAADASPSPVAVWTYEYSMPLPPASAFRLVSDGDWPKLMRSESRCGVLCLTFAVEPAHSIFVRQGAGPDWRDTSLGRTKRFYFHVMCNVVRAKPRCAELATWPFANLLRRRSSDERDY